MKPHNKKRNVGLIFELLLREVSSGLVEGVQDPGSVAVKVARRHFCEGSEIYREFRLFNALVRTQASSPEVARVILSEARQVACRIDPVKLDREKSLLISEINRRFDRESFYSRWVPEYRMYATIQTLLNDWRSPGPDNVTRIAEYEVKVRDWLMEPKQSQPRELSEEITPDVDRLVVKIMSEKVDQKFALQLSETQRRLVGSYVLALDSGDREDLARVLQEVKDQTLTELEDYILTENNQVLDSKVDQVRRDVVSLPVRDVTDEVIERYLTVVQLRDTVRSREGT